VDVEEEEEAVEVRESVEDEEVVPCVGAIGVAVAAVEVASVR